MKVKDRILLEEFFKKCWHQDVVPLGISFGLLFLNYLIGTNLYSITSMIFSIFCLISVLIMIEVDKKYILDISQGTENISEKLINNVGHFKLAFCVLALVFYLFGWISLEIDYES